MKVKTSLTSLFFHLIREVFSHSMIFANIALLKVEIKKRGKLSIHYSPYRGKAMYYFYLGIFIRIELKFKFIWKIKETNLPVSLLSYEQNKYGVLVWVAEAKWETNEGISSVKIPLVKYGDGHEIKHLEIDAPPGTEITLIKKRFKSR